MRHKPVEILGGIARGRESIRHDIGDHANRVAENFLPRHPQMTDRSGCGGAAIHIELFAMATI